MLRTCEAEGCEATHDIQYLVVKGRDEETGEGFHKEFYCQKHLRIRAAALELSKWGSRLSSKIFGWR